MKWSVAFSCVQLFATPWTIDNQAPLFMEFSRQECWSGLPFPSPGDFPDPGIEPRSPALQADILYYTTVVTIIIIMRNAGLDEAQAGVKIAGRTINHLR